MLSLHACNKNIHYYNPYNISTIKESYTLCVHELGNIQKSKMVTDVRAWIEDIILGTNHKDEEDTKKFKEKSLQMKFFKLKMILKYLLRRGR